MEDRFEDDEVKLLSAFSMGTPGKRTFFMAVGEKEKWERIWMEKYLLETLAEAVEKFLATLSREHVRLERGLASSTVEVPVGFPTAELDVDQMTLGYDRDQVTLNLIVHPSGPRWEDQKELTYRVSSSQLRQLGTQARKICAAGRPICAKCGNPIDPSGHICPPNN